MKNFIIHRADSRGNANHGWLQSFHTFSFAGYHNPDRVHFGALRVLNDDTVAPGMGFGTHPHDNMEIISIPLSGDLAHKDSMGSEEVIKEGDVQIMSAGTGVAHSEYNASKEQPVKFLQIWLFPDKRNVTPRYDQYTYPTTPNTFVPLISPDKEQDGLWIHQNAWFFMGFFDQDFEKNYTLHNHSNGVYLFVISGDIEVNGEKLTTRDAIGIWEENQFGIKAASKAQFLLMEVPMNLD